jgi:hypothetical protein
VSGSAPPARWPALLAALLLLAMTACDSQTVMEKFSKPEDRALAAGYIEDLRSGNLGPIEKAADVSIQGPALHDTLLRMAALIPPGAPRSVKLVGAYTNVTPLGTTRNLTFEFEFPGKWVLINVATLESAAAATIVGFHVYPRATSLEDQNRFRLGGKAPLQYLVLALAVVCPALTIYTLVLCARTRLSGRKWPWVIFILIGIGRLSVNWTSGQWQLHLLSVQLLSASVNAALYGPWVVGVSLPLGALVFLLRRAALAAPAAG